jgi:hypothetical protein
MCLAGPLVTCSSIVTLVALGTLLLVWAIFWSWFAFVGVPAWLPDWSQGLLRQVPGIV